MVRLTPNQQLVLIEKNTNAIYFVVVASDHKGILKLNIKGIINLAYVSRLSMHVYDMNRFCRYYELHDFHTYYEEQLTDKELINKSTNKEMTVHDVEKMMEKSQGYLILRLNGKKKKEFTQKEYEDERAKYLSLMHLAVNIDSKSMYTHWYQAYENVEKRWKQKEVY